MSIMSRGDRSQPGEWSPFASSALLAALILAGAALFLQRQQLLAGNLTGVPLDDAYIHFRFAQNLAGGHGFAFNPDQPVPGSTSPLWVLLLAAAALVGVPLWLAAKVFGILFLVVTALLTWQLAVRLGLRSLPALCAGALAGLDGRLLWAAPSGMEVTLFAALCLAAFLARPVGMLPAAELRKRLLLVALLCGLATLARPEGYLLAAVLAIDLYRRFRPDPLTFAMSAVLYLVLVVPYDVFALATTGHPLPTTFYAKAGGLGPWTLPNALAYFIDLIGLELLTNPVLLVMAPFGAVALWRCGGEAVAVVAWPLALLVVEALFSPLLYHFGRYVMPLEPFFAVWAVAGIVRLTARSAGSGSWRAVLPPIALVAVGVLTLNVWSAFYALSVRNIDQMQVAMGRWVRAHVPAGVPVATHDVGAIGYVSDHPVVDIIGLVTPRFIALEHETPARKSADDIDAAVRRSGARYLIIIPTAFVDLAHERNLVPVYSVTVDQKVIVPDNTMVAYRVR